MSLVLILLLTVIYYYTYFLVIYILLGWIGDIRESKLYLIMSKFAEPVLQRFRGIFVFSGLDFTPMILIIGIQLTVEYLLARF